MANHTQSMIINDAEVAFQLLQKIKNDPDHQVVFNLSIVKLPDYINTQQVMDLIGCSRSHVRTLMVKGVIKKVKSVVGQNRFERKEIQDLINNGLV